MAAKLQHLHKFVFSEVFSKVIESLRNDEIRKLEIQRWALWYADALSHRRLAAPRHRCVNVI